MSDAYTKIQEKIAEAMRLIEEAQKLADASGDEFDFSISYGMGGTYYPKGKVPDYYRDSVDDAEEGGWVASSQTC